MPGVHARLPVADKALQSSQETQDDSGRPRRKSRHRRQRWSPLSSKQEEEAVKLIGQVLELELEVLGQLVEVELLAHGDELELEVLEHLEELVLEELQGETDELLVE